MAAGAGLSVGLGGFDARSARPWGAYSASMSHLALGESQHAKQVLEIFLMGGISPWETFYVVPEPEYGRDQGHMWWTFQEGPNSVSEWANTCVPSASGLLTPFDVDALGADVHFGPFVAPLRDRADIMARLRMHVLSHELFPHDAAQALAYTGARIGQPHMAGVGAAVQRHTLGLGPLTRPASFVIADGYDGYAAAVGHHPTLSRPLSLRIQEIAQFEARLRQIDESRTRDTGQALLEHYGRAYASRLTNPMTGERVRSPALDDYLYTLGLRPEAGSIANLIGSGDWSVVEGLACGQPVGQDFSIAQLRLASHLLNLDTTRHVTVIDRAFDPVGSDPDAYDTHWDHVELTARKLPYFFERLVSVINEPGEEDPSKISLDDTLIILNTEFGRSLGPQLETGRNHNPSAYVTLMFGGPVGPAQRGIVGAIDATGSARSPLQPAETRAAALVALGINPFDLGGYDSDDINDASNDLEGLEKLRAEVLGIAV